MKVRIERCFDAWYKPYVGLVVNVSVYKNYDNMYLLTLDRVVLNHYMQLKKDWDYNNSIWPGPNLVQRQKEKWFLLRKDCLFVNEIKINGRRMIRI